MNRAATSADVKYAIERGLMPGVANGYESTYLGTLQGFKQAEAAVKKDPTKAPDISGIETPDHHTIVFKLTKPEAAVVEQALSLPISSPVPAEYAAKYDAKNPSTYGENQVATGPYMVRRPATRRARRSSWSEIRTGTLTPIGAPPIWIRSTSGRGSTTSSRPRRSPDRQRSGERRLLPSD